jgi:hypothetical protein
MMCPICNVSNGEHKMDCQNRYYVDQCTAQVEAELELAIEWIQHDCPWDRAVILEEIENDTA